jgi:hypothetical protein
MTHDIIAANTLFDVDEVPVVSKSNEWYTPARYIEAAREVMQGIDLDPASCEMANRTVRATRFYTKEQDGLSQEWYGRVWLNPPYGRSELAKAQGKSTIELFSSKLIDHYHKGEVTQAVFLGTSQIDARWFYPLWEFSLCFPNYKVHFLTDGKHTNYAHMFGTCFVYLGPNVDHFADTFSEFGPVVLPSGVVRRPAPAIQPTLWQEDTT